MKKFHLDLDVLDVQSFDTTTAAAGRAGTVHGHGTVGAYDSCAVSWCGDCQTGDDPACQDGGSGDCPSVNPMGCQSAFYSECCPSAGLSECCVWGSDGVRTTDPWDDCT